MLLKSKKTIVTLLTGVFILIASGCESSITTPSNNERETLQSAVASMEKAHSEIPMRKPGKIDPFNLTELLREMIRQNGGNPDELEFILSAQSGFQLASRASTHY